MVAFSDLYNELDSDGRVKGRQFEHICKWFLTTDPVYKHELRRVWLWAEWPGRWGGDAGIDLVAEDRNGHLWAIQAKAYDPAYRVTKRDVNKFLAESGREVFTYRMFIATTNLIDRIGERTIQDQEKRVTFFRLNDLQVADVDWPASPTALRPALPRKAIRPHDYQREAIKKVVKRFESTDRGQLIMACGTGKTLTALFVREKLAADRTLVLVPSLSLLKQTLNVWRANSTADFASLPVCSDDTVAVAQNDDLAVSHTSDLGVPVTTDPAVIAAFLRQRSGPRVVFATYQSSSRIVEAFAIGRVPAFDLVIADEAHRCAGPGSSDFATVLDGAKIRAKQRLFMTATPRYFTGRVLNTAEERDFEYASMNDEAKFGPVFYRLGFSEAIRRGLLTDYQVAIVGVDEATYRDWAERAALVTLDGVKVTDARTLAGQIGLAKAMRKYDLRRTISFHSRVKRARDFAASMPGVVAWIPARQRPKGHLWSEYASGEMPAGDRYVLLQHLGRLDDGERGLLANARCLAEGVDVPTLDGVAFIDPRRSEVDIVQAVGRAIRKSDEKTVGTIVIPVFIDTNADAEIALEGSAFKPVWDVIKALRSHDDDLGEELDELRRQLGRYGQRPRLPAKIHLDLPVRVGIDFALAFDVRLVNQTTASWEFWIGLLEKFIERQGDSRVPFDYTVDGNKLGHWVNNQRSAYDRGALSLERQHRLQQLPGWSWDPFADDWAEGFERLLHYVERDGDARIPVSYKDRGYPLGYWAGRQRAKHAQGTLDVGRQHKLEKLTGWTWDPHGELWEEGFRRVSRYLDQNGDCRVPQSYKEDDGYQLAAWIQTQRTNRAKGTLDPDRERKLQNLNGWTWQPRAGRWEEGFSRLLRYVDENGDARVPATYQIDGYPLGAWVINQRSLRIRDQLVNDRQVRLQNLNGWTWDTKADQWEEGFRRLSQYIEQNRDGRVPTSYEVDGYPLGTWVGTQRVNYSKGTLSSERRRRLEGLAGWTWHLKSDQWEEGFRQLSHYIEQNGNSLVPQSYSVDGYQLGSWVARQRRRRAKDNLESDREQRLQSLVGWTWDAIAEEWEEGFRQLSRYVEEYGDARVPRTYKVGDYQLAAWVQTQRSTYSKGILAQDRRHRLDHLPGWTWEPHAARWEEGFSRLLSYVKENGDARVPRSYTIDDYALGEWVKKQRMNHSKGTLDPDRERRLLRLPGWTWSASSR